MTYELSQEDSMAYGFLSRAANAIVQASDLSRQLSDTSSQLAQFAESCATLEEVKRVMTDRISTLEAQLASALDSEAQAQRDRSEALDAVAARQRDIDLLDATVADLRTTVASLGHSLDDALAKSDLQDAALAKLIDTHNAIRRAMGQSDLEPDPREEIEAASCISPSGDAPDDGVGDGRDDPDYRREPNPDYQREDRDERQALIDEDRMHEADWWHGPTREAEDQFGV